MNRRRVVPTLSASVLALVLLVCAGPSAASSRTEAASAEDAASREFFKTEARHRENADLLGDANSPGLYYPEGATEPVIRVFEGAVAAKAAKGIMARSNSGATTEASRYTAEDIEALAAGMESIRIPEGQAVGGSYRADRDLYVLTGSVDEALVKEAMPNLAYAYEKVAEGVGGRASRASDPSPHTGGASIVSSSGCTSGFAVKAAGATRMVTAAHCGAVGAVFKSPTGGYVHGSITHMAAFPKYDLAMISGSHYRGRIYTGASSTVRVAAAANPGIGSTYCFSGTTSGLKCNAKVTSMSGKLCDASGCTSPLIEHVGSTPQGGDSGGPFYAKGSVDGVGNAHIRGVVIGYMGSVGYAETWGRVADRFGASILVG